jgi:hypothetical protein
MWQSQANTTAASCPIADTTVTNDVRSEAGTQKKDSPSRVTT